MALKDKKRRQPAYNWVLEAAQRWTETVQLKRVIKYISTSEGMQDAAVRAAMVAEIARTKPRKVPGLAGNAGAEMTEIAHMWGLLAEMRGLSRGGDDLSI
jgi:hypothetical protein